MAKGPFLNSMRRPSLLRVPSGKTKIEVPCLRASTHSRNACICDLRSSRLMVRVLVAFIAKPTAGIFRISTLDTYLKGWDRWKDERMSMKDWWFATKTTAWLVGGRFSRPYTLVLKNGHVKHLHQISMMRSVSFLWSGSHRFTMGSATRIAGTKSTDKPYNSAANETARATAITPDPRHRALGGANLSRSPSSNLREGLSWAVDADCLVRPRS
mmetsp:Transcript_36607/g.73776  ORF Transcript_36607/g.73776 Transcript_36607/m.73776 type:complete len:213 (-) Transcript_36607:234-872(-)